MSLCWSGHISKFKQFYTAVRKICYTAVCWHTVFLRNFHTAVWHFTHSLDSSTFYTALWKILAPRCNMTWSQLLKFFMHRVVKNYHIAVYPFFLQFCSFWPISSYFVQIYLKTEFRLNCINFLGKRHWNSHKISLEGLCKLCTQHYATYIKKNIEN